MNHLYHSAFLKALGWSLIDSLWQMGVLWLSYILITGNGKRFTASYRYSLSLLAIFSGCLWFIVSFALNYYHVNDGERIFGLANFLQNGLPVIDEQKWMPLVSSFYLLIVLSYAARWIFAFAGNQKNYSQRAPVYDKYYESFVDELRRVAGITRTVRIWISEELTTPITFGFLKPVILLPLAAISQLTVKQVEAMIVHELYHIKRNDYLVNILITLCEILLFFNPFARLLIGNIRKERENCCDDEVINLGYDAWEYAQALYLLGKNSIGKYQFALAATGKSKQLLLQRVKRMLHRSHSSPSLLRPVSIFFLCLALAGSVNRDGKKQVSPVEKITQPTQSLSLVQEVKISVTPEPGIKKPKKVKQQIPVPPSPQPAPLPPVEKEPANYENMIVASYVSHDRKTIEFCMMEAQMSETKACQDAQAYDVSHPYIPGSTFYFPQHEMSSVEGGKTTIQL